MLAKLTIKSLNALENLKDISRDEEGASMVEYGVLVALICAVCVVIIGTLGSQVKAAFTTVSAALP